jgi:hypothetical protein
VRYPTFAQVETADRVTLGKWLRFLASPGESAYYDDKDTPAIMEAIGNESNILNRIAQRFHELGGWTPEVSKAVGWWEHD